MRLEGVRGKKQVRRPMFEAEVFRKQNMYCIEESTCDIVGRFRPPAVIRHLHTDLAPGELFPPCPRRYAPVCNVPFTL